MKNYIPKVQRFVSTQYGDLTGVIELDGFNNVSSIYDLCNDCGFDIDNRFIVGFGLEDSSISDEVYCKIIYVDKSEFGETFEEVSSKIRNKDTVVFVSESFKINYVDLKKYIKRFDFIALTEMADFANNIEIIEK